MKLITVIYKSGVVAEIACRDYHINGWGAIKVEDPIPRPLGVGRTHRDSGTFGMEDIAEIYEGRITGAHDAAEEGEIAFPDPPRYFDDDEPDEPDEPDEEELDIQT